VDKRFLIVIAMLLAVKWVTGLFTGCGSSFNTSSIKQKWLNLPYANVSSAQKLDIYLPNEGKGPFPVIVSIHGGGFNSGDKIGFELRSALEGLRRGYAIVSMNYRLSGEAKFPAQIYDVKAAIRFIRANAEKYRLNPHWIALWGVSAGGNLAALAGTSGNVKELEDLSLGNLNQSSKVQAVVDWYGSINYLTMDDQFKQSGLVGQVHNSPDSIESELLGKLITEAPDLVKMANPETYISSDDPPFFIQHGTQDKLIPAQQSVDFALKLQKAIGKDKVRIELLKGAVHGDPIFTTQDNLVKIFNFFDEHLK
jgi:acetyl esterase/lipase